MTGHEEMSTGWQYQNGDGHCLWLNDTSYELELGVACNAGDDSEDFYGLYDSHYVWGGWLVSNAYSTALYTMGMEVACPASGVNVYMQLSPSQTRNLWNFPSG